MTNFTTLFLIFSTIYLFVSLFLNYRQKKSILASQGQVPNDFSKQISLQQHQKAANYTLAKLKINNIEAIFSIIMLMLWTLGGGLELIANFLLNFSDNQLILGGITIISFVIIASIFELPFSIYRTFVLEQKFGFNKTSTKTFITDIIKNFIMSILIGLPLILAILYIMQSAGEFWWLYAWMVLTAFSLIMFWAYPSFIAPIFNKFKALENQNLADKIKAMLKKTGFKSNGLFVMDGSKRSSHGNAYFSGIGKNKRIVFFDTLLDGLNDNEILAVLAHELGHFHHKHIIKHLIISFTTTLVALAILGFLMEKAWFFNGLGVNLQNNYMALILFLLIAPVFSFFITPISNISSRKHEFEADSFAVKHTSSNELITALVKLYKKNASTLTPDLWYSNFYDSHPPASIRIKNINNAQQ